MQSICRSISEDEDGRNSGHERSPRELPELPPAAELLLAGHGRVARDATGVVVRVAGTVIRLPLGRRDRAR